MLLPIGAIAQQRERSSSTISRITIKIKSASLEVTPPLQDLIEGSFTIEFPDANEQIVVTLTLPSTSPVTPGSLKILKSTGQSFTDAVRTALPSMRFIPAEVKGHKVRQLIQQPFTFRLSERS